MLSSQKVKQKNKKCEAENDTQNDFDTIDQEDEPKIHFMRCLSCFSIPLLTLNSQTHTIKIQCNNGHENSMEINEYLGKCLNENLNNILCSSCNLKLDLQKDYLWIFCKECNSYLCSNCTKTHNIMSETKKHHIITLDKYDTTCVIHQQNFCFYCIECKQNICQFCYEEKHQKHKIFNFKENYLRSKTLKNVKENLNKEKEFFLEIEKSFRKLLIEIQSEFNILFEQKENEYKFKENIIDCYEAQKENYNIIQNIKELNFENTPFKIDEKQSAIYNLDKMFKYLNKKLEKRDSIVILTESSTIDNNENQKNGISLKTYEHEEKKNIIFINKKKK